MYITAYYFTQSYERQKNAILQQEYNFIAYDNIKIISMNSMQCLYKCPAKLHREV